MNRRLFLSIALFIAVVISFLAGVAVFGAGLLTPASARDLPSIRLAELREGEPVRVTGEAGVAYVIRLGDEIIAFSAIAPTVSRCAMQWHPDQQFFNDEGCLGARFDVHGRLLDGPGNRNLDQHPTVIQDGWVIVDTRTIVKVGLLQISQPFRMTFHMLSIPPAI